MELSELANPEVDLEIKGQVIKAKKANLKDVAEIMGMYEKSGDKITNAEQILISLKGIYLCIKKCNPEVTEDQVADMFSLKDAATIGDILEKLGFTDPTVSEEEKKTEEKTENK